MKLYTLITIFLLSTSTLSVTFGQANASLNVLTQNSGTVGIGGTVFLEVSLANSGPSSDIGAYKLKLQVAAPGDIVSISGPESVLPPGWTIINNDGSTINLSNGTDVIAVDSSRTLLLAMHGNVIGGPSTVSGQVSFSNGNAPGTAPGSLAGDNTADNSSTSTVEVTGALPVALTDFNIALQNCTPVVSWVTAAETNTDIFEIQKTTFASPNWTRVGIVAAKGGAGEKTEYHFTDNSINSSSEKILYRLKMIDKDGFYKFSEVLRVNANCNTAIAEVYPNPVQNGKLYVSISGTNKIVQSKLTTLSGQVLSKKVLVNGTNFFDVSTFAKGVYLLNIAGELNKNVKILITK